MEVHQAARILGVAVGELREGGNTYRFEGIKRAPPPVLPPVSHLQELYPHHSAAETRNLGNSLNFTFIVCIHRQALSMFTPYSSLRAASPSPLT